MKLKNLEEAINFIIMKVHFSKGNMEELKYWTSLEENYAVCNIHFTGGMKLRNDLNLWGENDLTKWFKSIGITHADDISSIIFTSLHRKLNKKDLELDKQIKIYQDHWKKSGFPDGIPKN